MSADDPQAIPLDAPFRPRRGRRMPLAMAAVVTLVFVGVAVLIPFGSLGDRLAIAGFGLLVVGLLLRYATIRATPHEDHLMVRNLVLTERPRWEDIEAVRFAEGDPWVSLELADADVISVMAIQRADAALGRAEADRLVRLIQARRGTVSP